jgi:ATP synthase protein I
MSDEKETLFGRKVASEAALKLRVQRDNTQGVWFGLGMSGLIGWSVATPTVAGVLIGVWLDHSHPAPFSWTLALLVAGLMLGCANAWHWVAQQDEAMRDE